MVFMKMIKSIPSFFYLLLLYNFILILGQSWTSDSSTLKFVLFDLNLASGKVISFYIEHILLVLGMIILYFEILRSTRNSLHTVIDHTLSTLVFIGFFTQFLLVPSRGNFTFLLLTLMSLLDVVAGFTISISNTRNSQFVTPSELTR